MATKINCKRKLTPADSEAMRFIISEEFTVFLNNKLVVSKKKIIKKIKIIMMMMTLWSSLPLSLTASRCFIPLSYNTEVFFTVCLIIIIILFCS
jgi:hypothetical protein